MPITRDKPKRKSSLIASLTKLLLLGLVVYAASYLFASIAGETDIRDRRLSLGFDGQSPTPTGLDACHRDRWSEYNVAEADATYLTQGFRVPEGGAEWALIAMQVHGSKAQYIKATPERLSWIGDNNQRNMQVSAKFNAYHNEALQPILQDLKGIERRMARRLLGIISDRQAMLETGYMMCGGAVNVAMGRIIAQAMALGERGMRKMPALVPVALEYSKNFRLLDTLTSQDLHPLNMHITMFLVSAHRAKHLAKHMVVHKGHLIFRQGIEGKRAFIKALKKPNTQICDPWANESGELVDLNRPKRSIYSDLLARADRLSDTAFDVITPELLFSGKFDSLLNYVFVQHAELWPDAQILEQKNQFSYPVCLPN